MRRDDLNILSNADHVFAFVQTDDRIAFGGGHGKPQSSDSLDAVVIGNKSVVVCAAILHGVVHKVMLQAGVVSKIILESIHRCETHESLDGVNDIALENRFLPGGISKPVAKNLRILEVFVGRPVELVALKIIHATQEGFAGEFVGFVIPGEIHLSVSSLRRKRWGKGRLGKRVAILINKFHHLELLVERRCRMMVGDVIQTDQRLVRVDIGH